VALRLHPYLADHLLLAEKSSLLAKVLMGSKILCGALFPETMTLSPSQEWAQLRKRRFSESPVVAQAQSG